MKFYIDSDPLLKFRPFPAETDNLFVAHWHEIVLFTLFYVVIMEIAPLINSRIFGKFYTEEISYTTKINFDIRIVGVVQSSLSSIACIPMFFHPMFTENPVKGQYEFAGLIASFTLGYFIWDLFYCCVYHFQLFGFEFLFHAFGALTVFGTTLIPFFQPFLCSFLIYELSTPFVQLHWFFTRAPKGFVPDSWITINGLILISTFFGSRLIWGVYATIKSIFLCWPYRHDYPFYLVPIVYFLNIGFQILNITWFTKMVRMATKKFSGKAKDVTDLKRE